MSTNETVIPLRSVTHAMKAKKLLDGHGIAARVVKPDARRSEKGCGYGVAVDGSKAEKVKLLLDKNGIPPLAAD